MHCFFIPRFFFFFFLARRRHENRNISEYVYIVTFRLFFFLTNIFGRKSSFRQDRDAWFCFYLFSIVFRTNLFVRKSAFRLCLYSSGCQSFVFFIRTNLFVRKSTFRQILKEVVRSQSSRFEHNTIYVQCMYLVCILCVYIHGRLF